MFLFTGQEAVPVASTTESDDGPGHSAETENRSGAESEGKYMYYSFPC